jgi:toxin ParE1/3/4
MVAAATSTINRPTPTAIMNLRILIHEDATIDLHEHCNYLAQNSQNSALQFFDAARQTFAALARMPGMGQKYESEDDDIINIRKWAVKGFKQYLIFYRYDNELLEILRIVHATRDLIPLLRDL